MDLPDLHGGEGPSQTNVRSACEHVFVLSESRTRKAMASAIGFPEGATLHVARRRAECHAHGIAAWTGV